MSSHRADLSADRTLFRGNTPLSKLLESTLRMLCRDFLVQSLGPAIGRLSDCVDGAGRVIRDDGVTDVNELERVWQLVESCWTDIYGAWPSFC